MDYTKPLKSKHKLKLQRGVELKSNLVKGKVDREETSDVIKLLVKEHGLIKVSKCANLTPNTIRCACRGDFFLPPKLLGTIKYNLSNNIDGSRTHYTMS